MKPLTRDEFTKKIEEMFVQFEEFAWNSTLFSGLVLRGHLLKEGKFRELLEFERNLIRLFPNEHLLFFNLIPPLVHLDQKKKQNRPYIKLKRCFLNLKRK